MHHISIARIMAQILLNWITPFAVLLALSSTAGKRAKVVCLEDERLEFRPNRRAFWAWLVLIAYLGYAIPISLKHFPQDAPGLIGTVGFIVISVMIIVRFPATIRVATDGLEQTFWLWPNKYIRWTDIVEINTGKKSRTVTVTAANGTKIIHSPVLADRPQLLHEIKQHCGDNLPSDFPREPISDL